MKKKLLMTASVWPHIETFHLPYLQEFRRLGWETHVGCAGAPAASPDIDRLIPLPFQKRIGSPANFLASERLRKLIREERYDLIITHTTLAAFFTRLALKGIPRRPELINVVHGYLFDDDTPLPKKQLLLTAERLTAPETDLLLTMNEWDFREAQRYHLAKRIERIPGMGVDFSKLASSDAEDRASLRRRHDIPEDAFVLLYAAEFSKRKSQRVLIEAMTKLPQSVVLVLCGTGVLWDECRRLAWERGLAGRVFFPGFARDMRPWYALADAVLSASRSEGLPFHIMEAMYRGLPVLASNVKGHTDLIVPGETGFLYPYGDAEACAASVRELLRDADRRSGIADRAKQAVRQYEIGRVRPLVMKHYLSD